MRRQFEILTAEGMALAVGEVRERHLVGSAHFGVHVMNSSCESVRRKPLGQCIWVQERSVDFFRRCTDHTMKTDGVARHDWLLSLEFLQIYPCLASHRLLISSSMGRISMATPKGSAGCFDSMATASFKSLSARTTTPPRYSLVSVKGPSVTMT